MTDTPKIRKKTKLLLAITKSNWGGAQKYVYDLATSLPQEEYEISVVFGGKGIKGQAAGRLKKELDSAGIRTLFIKSMGRDIKIFSEFVVFFSLVRIFKNERPDIVHLNSSKMGGLGSLASRIARIPKIVFTAHGWYFNERVNILKKAITYVLSWLTALFSTDIIVLSRKEQAQTKKMPFISDSKIHVVPISIKKFTPLSQVDARRELSEKYGLKYDFSTPLLGTIAELTSNKGYDFMIHACRLLKERGYPFSYVIVSTGELYDYLHNLAIKEGVADYIQFLGFVPSGARYLKAFDIFTLTSRKEGLPYTILEAGLAERPVIASNVGGIPEVIEQGVSGVLTNVGDVKGIAKSLAWLMENKKVQLSYGKKLSETVKDRHLIGTMVEKTISIYSHVDEE